MNPQPNVTRNEQLAQAIFNTLRDAGISPVALSHLINGPDVTELYLSEHHPYLSKLLNNYDYNLTTEQSSRDTNGSGFANKLNERIRALQPSYVNGNFNSNAFGLSGFSIKVSANEDLNATLRNAGKEGFKPNKALSSMLRIIRVARPDNDD